MGYGKNTISSYRLPTSALEPVRRSRAINGEFQWWRKIHKIKRWMSSHILEQLTAFFLYSPVTQLVAF